MTISVIQALFQPSQPCFLCGNSCHNSVCLCHACLKELPLIKTACNSCGLPMETETQFCGACISVPPPTNQCISALHYDSPVDYLIKHMKYHNQLSIAELMGQLLIEKIIRLKCPMPDVIIPVPLHIDRLKHRGYNQAIEIARPISKALNIPLNLSTCTRIKSTAPQFDLPASKRGNNIKNAFAVSSQLSAKHVALIDDVMTTGSTVWEVANTLLKTGVERVDVWSCARATTA